MSERHLVVIEPGLLTTVQDLGRTGLLRFGVTTGGALDQAALILGNRLVGNEPDAAGLEMTLTGPRLRVTADMVMAVTGADPGAVLNGSPVPGWQPFQARAGDELAVTPWGAMRGARAYLCLAGGIALPEVMGGRGTDLSGHFGGLDGRALRPGDRLPVGEASDRPDLLLRRRLGESPPAMASDEPFRVVLGPQADRFTAAAVALLLSEPYTVTPHADRIGLRLTGPRLEHTAGADTISEGIHQGSIQVPGDGQPIALTRARQTIGGYPKIATIIGADLDRLGQRRPGHAMRFAAIDVGTARCLTRAYHANLRPEAVITEPAAVAG
jgi:antagonist of KipI